MWLEPKGTDQREAKGFYPTAQISAIFLTHITMSATEPLRTPYLAHPMNIMTNRSYFIAAEKVK
jgi:hypothetical protein